MKSLTRAEMEDISGGELDCKEATTAIGMAACGVAGISVIGAAIAGPTCVGMIVGYTACAAKD